MNRRFAVLLCFVALLLLSHAAEIQAEEGAWQPASLEQIDPAPWRHTSGAWAAVVTDDEPALLEFRVAEDTFVASRYPFDTRSFGQEKSLWFGTDIDLGHVRTFLRWNVQPAPGGQYLGAAVYLPVAGYNANVSMEATAYQITSSWWGSINWYNQPPVASTPLARFTIGKEIGWYWFDVSALAEQWWQGASDNYGIQVRGPETTANVARGMPSREAGDDAPVPTLVISYMPDRTPPICVVNALPAVSPNPIHLQARCHDEQAGIQGAELQVRQGNEAWQSVASYDASSARYGFFDFQEAVGGQRYAFRVRASDNAGNLSEWTAEDGAVTTVESAPPVLTVSGALPAWLRVGSAMPDSLSLSALDPGPISSLPVVVEFSSYNLTNGATQVAGSWEQMTLLPGHRYALMARSVDHARNASSWMSLGRATAYFRFAAGQVTDVRGQPMPGAVLRSTPAAINEPTTDVDGGFALYRADRDAFLIESAAPSLVMLQQSTVASSAEDVAGLTLRAGLRQQAIVNGDFSAPLASGWPIRTGRAVAQPHIFNDADKVLRLGSAPAMTLVGQMVTPFYFGCMAASPDGTLHMVIPHSRLGDPTSHIYYTARHADSLTWDPLQSLGEFNTGAITYPGSTACLLSAATDGGLGLIYRLRNEDGYAAPAFRYRPPGSDWGPIEWLPPNLEMALVMGPAGAAHVLLRDLYHGQIIDYHLRYHYRAPGGSWRAPTPVASLWAGSFYATLLVGADNVRHVLWTSGSGSDGILQYAGSSDGQTWSSPQTLVWTTEAAYVANPILRLSPAQGLYAFWQQDASNVRYSHLVGNRWDAPKALALPVGISQVEALAVDADPGGRWHILLSPSYQYPYQEVNDIVLSGADLTHLATTAILPISSERRAQRLLASDATATNLLRHVSADPRYPGMLNPTPTLTTIPHEALLAVSSISQVVAVSANLLEPMLSWRSGLGHANTDSDGGELRTILVDRNGIQHELSAVTEVSDIHSTWIDVAPWLGQQVTLTFRFDPRGDPSAWAWVDDVHLGGMPLNAGVSLTPEAWPSAGQPFTFTLTAANRRPYPLTIPVELTWPADWPLTTDVAPIASSPGTARFEVALEGMTESVITGVANIPAGTELSVVKISAAIGQAIAAQDYTPIDNRADLTVIVDGLPGWLPLITR